MRARPFVLLFVVWSSCCIAQERVTLRLVDWADLLEIELDKLTIEAFERLHPDIDVLYEPNPGRQYAEKILTGLATDEPPDVFLLDSKLIPTFTNKEVLLDLNPYADSLGIDLTQWYPNVLDIARKKGALYAFPKGFTPLMFFYNRKLFDEAGVAYPTDDWTWDDYLSSARRLTRDTNGDGLIDQYGTAFTNYYFYWIAWVWSNGGDVVDPEGRVATGFLNSPRTESALQFCINLRDTFNVAPDVGSWVQAEKTGANYSLFAGGKIAMILDGHWRMPRLVKLMSEEALDIGVAPFPRAKGSPKVNVMYESGWCVPVNAKHPREAALLAAFMAGETACRIRSEGRLEIPSVMVVAEELVDRDTLGLERAFVNEVPYCRQPWGSIIERFSEIEWTLQDAVDEVMINDQPMHETMTHYAGRVDAELANIQKHPAGKFKTIREHRVILNVLLAVLLVSLFASFIAYARAAQRHRRLAGTAFGFLFPSLLHLVVFTLTPMVFAAYLSFHRWDIVAADQPFVGLDNFREMFADDRFWASLKNTAVYSLNVPLGMALSLLIALVMHRRLKGLGFLRTLYFLPSVTSLVAIALVWIWIYHPAFGAANALLVSMGMPPLQWLNSPQTSMLSLILFGVWLNLGYQMVIFLAGLQGIPHELYEASRIDGASAAQRFRHVTLPLLKPTTFFILVTSLISSFQVFASIYIMTAGGPVGSTDVIVYHIYQSAWEQLRMGYASALSWALFILLLAATWIQFKFLGREIDYA